MKFVGLSRIETEHNLSQNAARLSKVIESVTFNVGWGVRWRKHLDASQGGVEFCSRIVNGCQNIDHSLLITNKREENCTVHRKVTPIV